MAVIVEADKLIGKLDKLADLDYTQPLKDACLLVEREAKEKCPVASGELRRSIESVIKGNVGEVGSDLFYAPYVEYGTGLFSSSGDGRKDVPWHYLDVKGNWHTTSGQHPHPYLIPAYENNRDKIAKIFRDFMRENLND